MSGAPVYHGWTHRRKAQGGVDPLPLDLSMCMGSNLSVSQVITTTDELEFQSVVTNDSEIFRWDPDDPSGILIYKPGYYLFHSVVRFGSSDAAISKTIYQQAQPLSSGPDVFGNELGETFFSLGTGQSSAGIGQAPGPSTENKTELAHLAIAFVGNATNPSRFTVTCVHNSGADYTIGNLPSVSMIVCLTSGSLSAAQPPPS